MSYYEIMREARFFASVGFVSVAALLFALATTQWALAAVAVSGASVSFQAANLLRELAEERLEKKEQGW